MPTAFMILPPLSRFGAQELSQFIRGAAQCVCIFARKQLLAQLGIFKQQKLHGLHFFYIMRCVSQSAM
jgi:hypothetical protein